MGTIRQLEEINAWQQARHLAREIYGITRQQSFQKDYCLRDQMRRAVISVMSNIAEGFERSGTKEFLHFLTTAKASLGELRAQLYIALDQQYIDQTVFQQLNALALEISKMLAGLIYYLARTSYTGTKYK